MTHKAHQQIETYIRVGGMILSLARKIITAPHKIFVKCFGTKALLYEVSTIIISSVTVRYVWPQIKEVPVLGFLITHLTQELVENVELEA